MTILTSDSKGCQKRQKILALPTSARSGNHDVFSTSCIGTVSYFVGSAANIIPVLQGISSHG